MKTKLIIISTAALLAAGIGIHMSGHCPLQSLKAASTHTTAAPAQTTPAETK